MPDGRTARGPACRRLAATLLTLLLLAPRPAGADPLVSTARPDSNGFALVLGGGGALGLAHVGVIAELEAMGLVPSLVVGVSMGAIIGALASSGVRSDRMLELITGQAWQDLLLDRQLGALPLPGEVGWTAPPQLTLRLDRFPPSPPAGLSRGQGIVELIGRETAAAMLAAGNDFDRLPIPFRCTSTDLVTGEQVVHREGSLARAARASSSLPLVFTPVEMDGRLLVDGGFADNMPVEVARALGFQRILLVDVRGILLPPAEIPDDMLSVLLRTGELGQFAQNQVELRPGEQLLRIDLRHFGPFSYWQGDDIVAGGREAAHAMREELRALVPHSAPPVELPGPGEVELAGIEVLSDAGGGRRNLARATGLEPGRIYPAEELWEAASRVVERGSAHEAWVVAQPGAAGRAQLELHLRSRHRPELRAAGQYGDREGASAQLWLRADNLTLNDERLRLGGRYGDWRKEAWLESGFGLPWLGLRVSLPLRWEQQRYPGDPAASIARQAGPGLALPVAWTGWSFRASVQAGWLREGARRERLGGWQVELDTRPAARGAHNRAGGARLAVAKQEAALGADGEWWEVSAGGRHSVRPARRWRLELAAGGRVGSDDRPRLGWGAAAGPYADLGQPSGEGRAPWRLWPRLGIDYLLSEELAIGAAASHGWVGPSRHGLRPAPGALLRAELRTGLGPLVAGVQWPHHEPARFVLQLGHPF